MALTDFLALTDDQLRTKYEAKPADNSAVRKPFVKALKTAIDQYENGRTKAPNRQWTANGDTVKFTPKFKGAAIAISGKSEHFIPAERFVEAVKNLISSVEAGELDEVLNSGGSTTSGAASRSTGTRTPKTDEQKLKSRVSALRRTKSDAEIRKLFEKEGRDKAFIDAALAHQTKKAAK